jgi:glycosyltransferase involved in cell wall biosynthesis
LVKDAAALAESVGRLVEDASLRERLSAGARRRAAAFAPEALLPRYESVYRGLA